MRALIRIVSAAGCGDGVGWAPVGVILWGSPSGLVTAWWFSLEGLRAGLCMRPEQRPPQPLHLPDLILVPHPA